MFATSVLERTQVFRWVFGLIILIFVSGCHSLPPKETAVPFSFEKDRFYFKNQTEWNYIDGIKRRDLGRKPASEREYTVHCFVMSRSAVQFWKFARFDPNLPRPDPERLASLVREVVMRPTWWRPLPLEERTLFPGYSNLVDLSRAQEKILKENLGRSWPTLCRPFNFNLVLPITKEHQSDTNRELQAYLGKGHPVVIWIYNFPKQNINHVVMAYQFEETKDGTVYWIYDPNLNKHPVKLTYNPQTQTFSFDRTFYFTGGPVSVRTIYVNLLR